MRMNEKKQDGFCKGCSLKCIASDCECKECGAETIDNVSLCYACLNRLNSGIEWAGEICPNCRLSRDGCDCPYPS